MMFQAKHPLYWTLNVKINAMRAQIYLNRVIRFLVWATNIIHLKFGEHKLRSEFNETDEANDWGQNKKKMRKREMKKSVPKIDINSIDECLH